MFHQVFLVFHQRVVHLKTKNQCLFFKLVTIDDNVPIRSMIIDRAQEHNCHWFRVKIGLANLLENNAATFILN